MGFIFLTFIPGFLILTILRNSDLPYVSQFYGMERVYFQTMVILSPFFVIGGIAVARWLRARPHWIILPVLIPFFTCTTGTMYQIFSVPASIVLNSEGTEYEHLYIQDSESYAAKWLAEHAGAGTIRTDFDLGPRILSSQGKIPKSRVRGSLIADYQSGKDVSGYFYLFTRMSSGVKPLFPRVR